MLPETCRSKTCEGHASKPALSIGATPMGQIGHELSKACKVSNEQRQANRALLDASSAFYAKSLGRLEVRTSHLDRPLSNHGNSQSSFHFHD